MILNPLIILLLSAYCVISLKLPSYLTPCKKNDPNLNECFVSNGRDAISTVVKGDKKYKVLRTSPLELKVLNTDLGQNLQLEFQDLHGYGLDKISIKSGSVNMEKHEIDLTFLIPTLELISKYKINGRILVLPISGQGDTNITFSGGEYKYKAFWNLKKIKSKEHIDITKHTLEVTFEGARFHFDNLFEGDKILGENMNNILNENWKDVVAELGGGIGNTIGVIINSILQAYFSAVPYNEIFID